MMTISVVRRIMRTLVDIPEPDVKALDELGRRRRVSRSRVIREAVRDYLERHEDRGLAAFLGLWGTGEIDGVEYQRKVRSEW
jgi:Arc/MetJ-type ribon-helix-helix transcriptional regulator